MTILIPTKLHIPQVRAARVVRPRLVTRLQQGLDKRLILVSAPAGYGKTMLVGEWVANFPQTAWVSLNKNDNDPARFWAYACAALQGVCTSSGKPWPDRLTGFHLSLDETLLTELLNILDQWGQPLFLVLDDYHFIHAQAIHEGILFLLEHAPANFHLVITTRADPPLSLAKFRARSEMLEVRQADLCFTASEASDFLSHTMGLQVTPEDVIRLTERTEGWIAGLQMAALSMQNTEDISGFITALTGTHHYIFDYLLDEILERQSPEIRRFLLYTSILEQLTTPLCDALFAGETLDPSTRASTLILEELERTNLFIQPLDHERRWYRYHALFAELLRGYLQRTHAEQIPALHVRASVWFEQQGFIADAIHHALEAGEWERVVRFISTNVFALLEQNELNAVIRQLDQLTSESGPHPWLWIGRAWLAAYTGQMASVESLLNQAELAPSRGVDATEQQTLRGHIAAIRAYTAWILGNRIMAVQSARDALECLPESDLTIRCQSATVLGLSLDNLDEREQAYEMALKYAQQTRVSHVVIFAFGCQAFLLLLQGKLHEAHATCREAILIASSIQTLQPFPSLSHVYSTLSEIHREWNDLGAAVDYAREAVSLARRWEQVDALHYACTNLGEALFAVGDVEGAFNILEQAWQIARRTSAWFVEITIAQEVKWHLEQGNLEAVLQCLRQANVEITQSPSPHIGVLLTVGLGEYFLAMKQYEKALATFSSILNELESRKVIYLQIRPLVGQAIGFYHIGQKSLAIESLKKALHIAAPEGCIRSFPASDVALKTLLNQARTAGGAPDYIGKLLAWVERGDQGTSIQSKADDRLVDPLSEREIEVLRFLAQGYADKKIAATLIIARGTVHKHLKNIYEKLGVHSRTEAIARARESGLL